ncbi:MAG: hypothetical protein R3E87_22200 [Burkholderiaceae bacterium]
MSRRWFLGRTAGTAASLSLGTVPALASRPAGAGSADGGRLSALAVVASADDPRTDAVLNALKLNGLPIDPQGVPCRLWIDSALVCVDDALATAAMLPHAFDPGVADICAHWFAPERPAADSAFTSGGSPAPVRGVGLPVGIFADSLGLWSNRRLVRASDLQGLRLAADPARFGFLGRLGITLVSPPAGAWVSAMATGEVDLILSEGPALDARRGLFDAPLRCYSPGLRSVVATAWLTFEASALGRLVAAQATAGAGLPAIVRASVLDAFASDHHANDVELDRRLGEGFKLLAMPDLVIDAFQTAYEAWRADDPGPASDLAALRDRADRLTRANLARYLRHVG